MPTKKGTIYIFEGAAYDWTEMNEHIMDTVIDRYPEIVHSDFLADESAEYEDLWSEVEEMDYTYWKLKDYVTAEVKEVVETFSAIKDERELTIEDYHDFVNSIIGIYDRRINR